MQCYLTLGIYSSPSCIIYYSFSVSIISFFPVNKGLKYDIISLDRYYNIEIIANREIPSNSRMIHTRPAGQMLPN